MKNNVILFDLDGTLTDPKLGITKSVQYALKSFDIIEEDLDSLEKFIGPPLKQSFMEFYDFDENTALVAIEKYREYFKVNGMYENNVYPMIHELLEKLCNMNKRIAVATSKPTEFALEILRHFDMLKYFEIIVGSNMDGSRVDKWEVISFTLDKLGVRALDEVIMIGDRKHDIFGAQKVGIASIGVLYGYGSREELEAATPTYIVDSVDELSKLLIKK